MCECDGVCLMPLYLNRFSAASGARVPPAGGERQPPWHRVVAERHHHPDVPLSNGLQRASRHPGGCNRSPAERHGWERSGKTASSCKDDKNNTGICIDQTAYIFDLKVLVIGQMRNYF